MIKHYSFILNHQKFKLPANIDNIEGLPHKIINELLQNFKYEFELDVDGEVFQEYINHLTNREKLPEINLGNIFQYHLLSDHFNILSDYLKQPHFEELYKISALFNTDSISNNDKSIYEKYISEHLDYYLMKHKKEMQHIPITSLYNIFYHKDRILHNHEIAYNFITQNDNQNQSLFILLRSLEGQKLTKESLNDSFLQIEKHFGFAPKCDFSFIEKNNTYTINLLIITVDNQEIIDFNFIKQLNKENFKYKINLSHIYDKILYKIEMKQFFLSHFDIIAFGGCDSFSNYTCKISQKEFDYFDSFHKEGGIILFMHDFFFSKYVKIFRPLADLLGYIDHPEFHVYNEITFNDLCGKNDIITTPFKLNKVIKVSNTHQTP